MKENIKNQWVKALRSDEFKQCQGRLEKDGKYCALGVLSTLALIEGICTYNNDETGARFDNKKFFLSFNVMKWAGIKNYLEEGKSKLPVKYRGRNTSIADLNDGGKTFNEIADIIEKVWRHL